jgi:hypothetical protein
MAGTGLTRFRWSKRVGQRLSQDDFIDDLLRRALNLKPSGGAGSCSQSPFRSACAGPARHHDQRIQAAPVPWPSKRCSYNRPWFPSPHEILRPVPRRVTPRYQPWSCARGGDGDRRHPFLYRGRVGSLATDLARYGTRRWLASTPQGRLVHVSQENRSSRCFELRRTDALQISLLGARAS